MTTQSEESYALARAKLVVWLSDREDDIANSIEDFGELKEVFKVVFGRDAASS
jgi:hypothetical protein